MKGTCLRCHNFERMETVPVYKAFGHYRKSLHLCNTCYLRLLDDYSKTEIQRAVEAKLEADSLKPFLQAEKERSVLPEKSRPE